MLPIGSADAYFLARQIGTSPLFILAANAQDAERLTEEIAWFAPQARVHRLPDWETLAYDRLSPHPDLTSERVATLHQFLHGAFDVGIVPVTTAMARLCPKEYLAGRSFFIQSGKRLDVTKREDASLLGGVVAKVGDVVYDGSLKTQLRTLRDQLA